jgi:uncharacterized membrane protein
MSLAQFAISLLVVRILLTRQLTYIFLVWNLFLAWLPYLLSVLVTYACRRHLWLGALPAAGCWLLFFPNAPYIITDFLHLAPRAPIPQWYDLLILASFSWTGMFLALVSLATLHTIVGERIGRLGGWAFATLALALGSLGIYLGRFLRWNSWDLFFNTRTVLADLGTRALHPLAYRQTYAVTILFFAFLFTCYLIMAPGRRGVESV